MLGTVYLETSFVSYLCGSPSRDLIVAGNQRLSLEWWEKRRHRFDCSISELVLEEIIRGDPEVGRQRLALVTDLPILRVTEEGRALAEDFMNSRVLPAKAWVDALHIAVATIHSQDYVLTLNCRHIANAEIWHGLRQVCAKRGFELPILTTPGAFMGRR